MSEACPEFLSARLLRYKYEHLVSNRCVEDCSGSFFYMKKNFAGVWTVHNEYGPAIYWHHPHRLGDYALNGRILNKEEFLARTSKLGKILHG